MKVGAGRSPARAGTPLVFLLGCLVALGAFADAAAAQDLGRVAQLGADGRTSDARDALLAWWDIEWDEASRPERERALWLRGVLTLDPVAASDIYRRLVVEYPVGAYSERALARLGQMSAAVGDTLGATRWFTVLERDYPRSEEAVTASVWLSDHSDATARAAERGRDPRGRDPVTPVDTSPRDSPPVTPPADTAAAAEMGDWTVQLGAFSSEVSARRMAEEVRAAGFDVRVVLVEGSDLWRIRSGRFLEDDEARPLAARMVEAGFQAAVSPGASDEIGGG